LFHRTPLPIFRSPTIVAFAAKSQLPAIYAFRRFAAGGGLAAYGVDAYDQVPQALLATADEVIE
jgi:hypothetical protein